MARIKGAKNRATVIAEEMIAQGMDPKEAKMKARMQYAREKKLGAKATAKKASKKVSKKKTVKKVAKSKREYPAQVDGYNTTTKNAWWKAKKDNPKSRKMAIRAMCLLCCGGSVKEAKMCQSPECPLYAFRITG